ncbi:MAG TPA: NAD-dependent epimerase/dehydratase family protein [Chloroflexota bacterium]
MTVLVTGGAGFIGSHLAASLLERGERVVVIDIFDPYYSPRRKWENIAHLLLHPRFRLHVADVRDRAALERVFLQEGVRRVVHLAALAGVRASFRAPSRYAAVNVLGTGNVLETARRHGVEGVVFASSSSVYGASSRIPFSEDDPLGPPTSPYAATKRVGELLCRRYHRLYGLPCTCLRFFSVYGPRGRPDMAPYRFARHLLEGRPVTVFGDGTCRRDYTYVDDVVAGTIAALDANLPFEVINLGSGRPITVSELIRIVERLTGRRAVVHRQSAHPGDVPTTHASIAKARRLLGYAPSVSIEQGMAKLIAAIEAEDRGSADGAAAAWQGRRAHLPVPIPPRSTTPLRW